MATDEMGYRNYQTAIRNVVSIGKLRKTSYGVQSADMNAFAVLTVMCMNTYDWPLPDKLRRKNAPARLYRAGLQHIVDELGLVGIPQNLMFHGDKETVDKLFKRREQAGHVRVNSAIKFLKDRGVIKVLQKGYLGRNTAYLLCIGATDEENNTVEHYDRRVLGMIGD